MKFKDYKKLILPTIIATLLVCVPVQSDAITEYNFTYGTQRINYSNTIIVSPSNNYYTVVKNQPSNSYYTISGNQNQITTNYYVVSRSNYLRTVNNTIHIERSIENVQPKPQEPQPTPQPKPQPVPQPNPNTTSNERHSLTSEEIQMVDYVNKARQDAGLQPLQVDVDLAYIARLKSQDMYDNNYFSHDSPTYGSPFEMMTKFGIKYRGAAENIAKNNSVASAHNALMRSQGHKDNILNPIYTHIGIGIHNRYYTQMFIRK